MYNVILIVFFIFDLQDSVLAEVVEEEVAVGASALVDVEDGVGVGIVVVVEEVAEEGGEVRV